MARSRSLFIFLASGCLATVYAQQAPVAERVRDANRRVTQGSTEPRMLSERAEALYQLMESDPKAALTLALPEERQAELRRSLPANSALVERSGQWTGPVQALVEDDFQNHRSRTRWFLQAGTERLELYFAGPAPEITCEREFRVAGFRLQDRMVVDEVAPGQSAGAACSNTGVQNSLVILANYPGTPVAANVTPAFLQSVFAGPGKSVDGFWKEVSYGKTSVSVTVIGPVTLDANYGCEQNTSIQAAALKAADPLIDLTQFNRVFVVIPPGGTCTWAGLGSIGCWTLSSPTRGPFQSSISWLMSNVMWSQDVAAGLSAHEGGHNLGLSHSTSLDYDTIPLGPPGASGTLSEYGDLFSNMGDSYHFGHYTAPQKLQLGWIDGATNVQTVQENGTFNLAPLESASAGLQAIKVRRGLGNTQWLWLESRQPNSGYETFSTSTVYSGALVHYEDPSDTANGKKTKLLNFGPAPHAFSTAALVAGNTWADPSTNLSLRVNSAGGSGVSVTVSYTGSVFASPAAPSFSWQQGAAAPANQAISLSSSGQSFSYTGAVSSTGNWLVLNTASGSVPGSASIGVNTTGMFAGTYTGSLTLTVPGAPNSPIIVPVTLTVTPNADAPQAVSVTPASGTGGGQLFSFVFSDPVAVSRLQTAEINIHDTNGTVTACHLRFDPAANTLALDNDAGTAWGTAAALGSAGILENTQCVVSPAMATAAVTGANLTLTVPVSFKAAYAGVKNVYMLTRNAGWSTGWQQRGTWTADTNTVPLAVTPSSGSGNNRVFSFLYADPKGMADFGWVYGNFNTTNTALGGCSFQYSVTSNYVYLLSDTSGGSGSSSTPGASGTAENGTCVITGAGSSVIQQGNHLTLNLNVGFKPAFAGARNIYMNGNQKGAWTVTAAQLPVKVTPDSGSGASQTFAFVFTDPASASNFTWVDMNFSPDGGTGGSCYARYDRAANALLLRNDGDTAWIAPLTPGGGGLAQNSQCSISAAGSSATAVGANVTVNVAVSFRAPLAGANKVYMQTPASGWQQRGAWTVNAALSMISVTPSSGSGTQQDFVFAFSSSAGAPATGTVQILIGASSASTAGACGFYYSFGSQYGYSFNDAGSAADYVYFGASGVKENSQCIVNAGASSVVISGGDVILTLAITFKAAYAGAKNIYMMGSNSGGYTPWQLRGTWSAVAGQYPVSVTPASGSGASQNFSFVFADTSAGASLPWVEMRFAGTSASCLVRYDQTSNALLLRNDAGSAWSTPLTPGGSGVAQNSQCAVSAAGSSVLIAGARLTVNLAMSFLPTMTGAVATSLQTPASGFEPGGSWTVNGAPAVISVTPDTGSGAIQKFTVLIADPGGIGTSNYVELLIGASSGSTANVCKIRYYHSSASPYLYDDAGASWSGTTIGSGAAVQNSQCVLNAAGSSAVVSGNNLSLTLALAFKPVFAGLKNIYVGAGDTGFYTSWQLRGAWTVTAGEYPVSVAPVSGSGTSQSFSFVFADAVAGANLPWVEMKFAGAGAACLVRYDQTAKTLLLRNDADNAWSAPLTPGGSGSAQNSQCILYAAGSPATVSGALLAVNAALTFRQSMAGNLSVSFRTPNSGWQPGGTWTVNGAPAMMSVTPDAGQGPTANYTILISRPNGIASSGGYGFKIADSGSGIANVCSVVHYPSSDFVYLYDDAGTSAAFLLMGSQASVQNSQCTLLGAGSSASVNGDELTLTLSLAFKPAFAGMRKIYLSGGTTPYTPWQQRGAWDPTACGLTLSATSAPATASGGAASVAVTGAASCSGSVVGNAAWISVPAGANVSGGGTVNYTVAASALANQRTGTLGIGGATFTVTQAGATPVYTLTPATYSASAASGVGNVALTVNTQDATWRAASNQPWLSIYSGGAGTGNATIYYSFSPNTGAQVRTAAITVGDATHTVTQAASGASFTLAPASASVGASAASGTVNLTTTPANAAWSASSNQTWLTITSGASGNGDAAIGYSATANSSVKPRVATIAAGNAAFTLTQAGMTASYSLTPVSASLGVGSGSGTVALTATPADATWTATSTQTWLTITSPTSGTGSANIAYAVSTNGNAQPRSAVITVNTATFTVTQAGTAASFSFTPSSVSVGSGASAASVTLNATPADATWTASSGQIWLSITSGGSGTGNGSIGYSVVANTSVQPRSAAISVGGATFTVTQAGAAASFSFTPPSASVGSGSSSGSVTLNATPADASWTATSSQTWLTINAGRSGTGSAAVSYAVTANPGAAARSATITVGAAAFTLTQAAAGSSLALTPVAATAPGGGTTGYISVAAIPATLNWTATSNSGWLTITSGSPGIGSGAVGYTVAPNAAGAVRTAVVTIGVQTFTLTQAGTGSAAGPMVADITPYIGSGYSQLFKATYRSMNGWADLTNLYFMVNVVRSPSNSCYVEVDVRANTLRLISDDAVTWLAPMTPGSGWLQNGACTVNGAGSSVRGSGTDVTVNLAITFQTGFVGKRGIFLSARDYAGTVLDWSPYGAWWPNAVTAAATNWYRLFDPSTSSHHYTTDAHEYSVLSTGGFTGEGSAGRMYDAPGTSGAPNYRIYFNQSRMHFWTTDRNEYLTLIRNRYYYAGEGVDGFMPQAPATGTVPYYRLVYCCAAAPIHHWTTDAHEHGVLQTQGWTSEGVVGYLLQAAGTAGR